MITTMRQRVKRRSLWAGIASIVLLLIVEALGYALVTLLSDIGGQLHLQLLYWCGGLLIFIGYGFGIVVDQMAIRTWDTWLDDLGPLQIGLLIGELQVRKRDLDAACRDK